MSTKGKMEKKYKQTYEIYAKNNPTMILGVDKYAPPFPSNASYVGNGCWVKDYGYKTITWNPVKTVIDFCDGSHVIFWTKPTIADVMSINVPGQYYQKFPDGSVVHGCNGVYHHWGPDEPFDRNAFERYRKNDGFYYDSDGYTFADYVDDNDGYDDCYDGYDSW